jgi:hypothetical protein
MATDDLRPLDLVFSRRWRCQSKGTIVAGPDFAVMPPEEMACGRKGPTASLAVSLIATGAISKPEF